jgi:hypothetical protein
LKVLFFLKLEEKGEKYCDPIDSNSFIISRPKDRKNCVKKENKI